MSVVEPIHPLAAVAKPGRRGAPGPAPLIVTLPRRDIVQVLARRQGRAALAAAAQAGLGLALPDAGGAATGGGVTAAWTQRDGWMLSAPRTTEGALARRLSELCGDLASVVDQSHGRTMIVISGPAARGVLSKGCRFDLHPRSFGPGRAASTQIAQVGCLIHQADDLPTYELTVFSTLAEPFLHWLLEAASEAGAEIR